MLAVDASALVAILLKEPEALEFSDALMAAGEALISPVNLWEVATRVHSVLGMPGVQGLELLLDHFSIEVSPTTTAQAWSAVEAARRFGRGTPARLNLGDCFAYALAQAEDLPLLFKGDDFPRTDVRSAL